MTQERMNEDVIYIVNLNHEKKRNLEALKRKVERRLKKKSRRYVSRAEKQILGFLVMVLDGMTGLTLTVTGNVIGGFAANVVALLGLVISCHYE